MKRKLRVSVLPLIIVVSALLIVLPRTSPAPSASPVQLWTTANSADTSGIVLVKNPNGPTLGYSSRSGVRILTVDGLAFKDLNKNGKLDKYEDWRLPADMRAKDLASKLSVAQIAGLMLYSAHQ